MTIILPETKDPSELKDYEFDWSPKLASGESISAQRVSFVDAAGTTNPQNSNTTDTSRIWLAGGNQGQRCIFTVQIDTSGGRTFEVALGVDIVDSVLGVAEPTDLETYRARLIEARAALHDVAIGDKTVEFWRDGRRMVYSKSNVQDLQSYIRWLEGEIASLENVDAGGDAAGFTQSRRPFTMVY